MTTAPTPPAITMANLLEGHEPVIVTDSQIAAELRRLHAENERLQGSLEAQRLISDRAIAIAKELEARKPLSPDALADKCEAWLQEHVGTNIVDAFEAGCLVLQLSLSAANAIRAGGVRHDPRRPRLDRS